MAAVIMSSDEMNNPIFHDFLGMICGGQSPAVWAMKSGEKRAAEAEAEASVGASSRGHGHVSGSCDLGSERHLSNNFECFQFQGKNSDICGSELDSRFSGRNRSNSDSAFMGRARERMLPAATDSLQSSHLTKVIGKEFVSSRPRRSHDEQSLFAMQPPQRATSTFGIAHAPIGNKHGSGASKLESSMPINAGAMAQYHSRFSYGGAYDTLPSSGTYRGYGAGTSLISHAAADEGSRTGMKGSKILNFLNSNSGVDERNSSGMFTCHNRQKAVPQNTEPESSNIPSRRSIATTCLQMTIFYAGQAHVFDDVHPNKADAVMALAGSNGGSWSTTYPVKACSRPPSADVEEPGAAKATGINCLAYTQELNSRPSVQQNRSPGFGHLVRTPVASSPSNLTHGTLQGARSIRNT